MPSFEEIWKNGELLATLLEGSDATIEMDKYEVASGTITYQCQWDLAVQLVREIARHPTYSWLVMKKATIKRDVAYMANVTVTYEGVDPTTPSSGGSTVSSGGSGGSGSGGSGSGSGDGGGVENEGLVKRVYGMEGASAQEPIETHSKFTEMAGVWNDKSSWVHGAKFVPAGGGDDEGRFLGFMPTDNAGNPSPLAGMTNYITGSILYTEVRTYGYASSAIVAANMNGIGKISNPPSSSILPEVSDGRNWLLYTADAEEVGDGMKITRKWRLSGPGGWNNGIYG